MPLVAQLRRLNKDAGRRASKASPTADVRKKWLSWDQYLGLCKTLEHEVAPRWHAGGTRTDAAVAWIEEFVESLKSGEERVIAQ